MGNRLPNQENQAQLGEQMPYLKKNKYEIEVKPKEFKEQEVQVNDIQKLQEQQEDKEVQELIDLANNDFDDLSDQMNKLNCQLEDLQNDLDKYI